MFSSISYISSFVATSAFNAFIIRIVRFPSVYSRSPFFSTTALSFYHKKFSSFLSKLSIHWTPQPTFPNQKKWIFLKFSIFATSGSWDLKFRASKRSFKLSGVSCCEYIHSKLCTFFLS